MGALEATKSNLLLMVVSQIKVLRLFSLNLDASNEVRQLSSLGLYVYHSVGICQPAIFETQT